MINDSSDGGADGGDGDSVDDDGNNDGCVMAMTMKMIGLLLMSLMVTSCSWWGSC